MSRKRKYAVDVLIFKFLSLFWKIILCKQAKFHKNRRFPRKYRVQVVREWAFECVLYQQGWLANSFGLVKQFTLVDQQSTKGEIKVF